MVTAGVGGGRRLGCFHFGNGLTHGIWHRSDLWYTQPSFVEVTVSREIAFTKLSDFTENHWFYQAQILLVCKIWKIASAFTKEFPKATVPVLMGF